MCLIGTFSDYKGNIYYAAMMTNKVIIILGIVALDGVSISPPIENHAYAPEWADVVGAQNAKAS